jgi:hypothetical protein
VCRQTGGSDASSSGKAFCVWSGEPLSRRFPPTHSRPGYDANAGSSLPNAQTATAAECLAKCASTPTCNAFTWTAGKTCWMTAANNPGMGSFGPAAGYSAGLAGTCASFTSTGTSSATAVAPTGTFAQYGYCVYSQSDANRGTSAGQTTASSLQDCAKQCTATSGCVTFTFTGSYSSSGTCYMSTETGQLRKLTSASYYAAFAGPCGGASSTTTSSSTAAPTGTFQRGGFCVSSGYDAQAGGTPYSSPTLNDCIARCDSISTCNSFTFTGNLCYASSSLYVLPLQVNRAHLTTSLALIRRNSGREPASTREPKEPVARRLLLLPTRTVPQPGSATWANSVFSPDRTPTADL